MNGTDAGHYLIHEEEDGVNCPLGIDFPPTNIMFELESNPVITTFR